MTSFLTFTIQYKGIDIYDVVQRRAFDQKNPFRRVLDDEKLDASEYELWFENSKSKDKNLKDLLTV